MKSRDARRGRPPSHQGIEVVLLYFDGCPNWREAEARVRRALCEAGLPEQVLTLHRVQTSTEAERLSFRGSPSVLVNGVDPFADPAAPVGLACRLYRTARGVEGSPSVSDLAAVFCVRSTS